MIKKSIIAFAALTACGSAFADPVSIGATVAAWYGKYQLLANIALLVVTTSYTSAQARKQKRKAEAEARAQHNASLEDRPVTLLNVAPPARTIYGRCIVGGDIVAMFTTDKNGRDSKGKAYTKKDGYKHVVVRIADHEVEAIHGAFWSGVSVGPLSGIGNPTYAEGNGGIPVGQSATTGWATGWVEERTVIIRGDTKLPYKVSSLISAVDTSGADRLSLLTVSASKLRVTGPNYDVKLKYNAIRDDFANGDVGIRSVVISPSLTSYTVPNGEVASTIVSAWVYSAIGDMVESGNADVAISPDGRTLSISSLITTGTLTLSYTIANSQSKLKFAFHRGTPGQTADAYLRSIVPDKWSDTDVLEGMAYAVVTFDLEDPRFQGGPTEVSFDVSGKRLYDPRTDTTYFSRNNALVANDYLRMRTGVNVTDDDIEQSYLIAAANVCDTPNAFTETDAKWGTTTTITEPLYTFNGLVTSDEGREAVLAGIAQSMAGSIVDSSQWLIIAGAWTPTVMDLTEDDLFGSIDVVQGDNGGEDTFNGVRGRYTPRGLTQPTDMTPYLNSTLVTADGAKLYDSQEYKYTDSNARCVNLARIHVELSRTGLVIRFPAKTSAWPLQIGDRVRVKTTDANFGFDYKKFKITDWQHSLQAPVMLTLQEDEPETYDTIDTALADPTKDITLANPWLVEPVTGIEISSGTDHLVLNSSGGVMVRALVEWDEPTDAYVANGRGRVEVWYRAYTPEGVPEETWYRSPPSQGQNSVYLDNLADRQPIEVEIYAVNSIGVTGPSEFRSHVVVGRTEPPSNVTGVTSSVNQGIIPWSWDYPPDLDYDATEVRAADSDWGSLVVPPLWRGRANNFPESVTFAGNFTRYFKHLDTGGRYSVTATMHTQTVDVSDLGPDVTTYRLDITPVSGTLYTDYRGVVSNFSTADAVIRVKKSDGSDDTSNWTLTKVDTDVVTDMTSGGDLTILSFPTNVIEENYYGTMMRASMRVNMQDDTRWTNGVTQLVSGSVTYSGSGGPFTDTGYIQMGGAGGAPTGLKYGPNTYYLAGFRTNWSLSGWIMLTEYPSSGTFFLLSVGSSKQIQLTRDADVAGSPRYVLYGRYFGFTSSGTGEATVTSPPLSSTDLPLNTWIFVETTWSTTDKKQRIFKDGTLLATGAPTTGSVDLASYVETYIYSLPASSYVYAGVSAGYEIGNPANGFRNGRLADIDYTIGGSVHIASYAPPTKLRSNRSFIPQSSTLITATAGTSVLQSTYTINTVEGAPALIEVRATRTAGVVKASWDSVNYDYTGATVNFQVLVNGRNDTANWDFLASQFGTTASITFSANATTKTLTVSNITDDEAAINVLLSNPGYPPQYVKYVVARQKDAKPAQTSSISKTSITLAGDLNGLATDFSAANTQMVMYEGGTVATGWSYSVSVTSGITYTHSNGLVTITAMDTALDQGSITITATKSGWTSTVMRCEVVKTRLLLPDGAVVVAIPAVSVFSTASGSASGSIRFRNNGVIDSSLNGGGYTTRGRWFNPTTGTPGNSYSAFFNGTWHDLTTDLVITASATGDGASDEVSGTVIIAPTAALTNVLGNCPVYIYTYATPGGA